jgi:hypothetical protein
MSKKPKHRVIYHFAKLIDAEPWIVAACGVSIGTYGVTPFHADVECSRCRETKVYKAVPVFTKQSSNELHAVFMAKLRDGTPYHQAWREQHNEGLAEQERALEQ